VILPVHQLVRSRVTETVGRLYSVPAGDPAIVEMGLELPPRRVLGDLAVPVAFALARRLRKAPRAIAQELAAALGPMDGVARVEAAPNGYLNFFLDRAYWMQRWAARASGPKADAAGSRTDEKVIVEHTAINPNKAAHIGHLRNAALGDAFGRLLRFQGRRVEIQNYIDDTGVQVADVVVGFRELERKTLADIRAIAESSRFD
jgi:arginyl-tRNA synthetase